MVLLISSLPVWLLKCMFNFVTANVTRTFFMSKYSWPFFTITLVSNTCRSTTFSEERKDKLKSEGEIVFAVTHSLWYCWCLPLWWAMQIGSSLICNLRTTSTQAHVISIQIYCFSGPGRIHCVRQRRFRKSNNKKWWNRPRDLPHFRHFHFLQSKNGCIRIANHNIDRCIGIACVQHNTFAPHKWINRRHIQFRNFCGEKWKWTNCDLKSIRISFQLDELHRIISVAVRCASYSPSLLLNSNVNVFGMHATSPALQRGMFDAILKWKLKCKFA